MNSYDQALLQFKDSVTLGVSYSFPADDTIISAREDNHTFQNRQVKYVVSVDYEEVRIRNLCPGAYIELTQSERDDNIMENPALGARAKRASKG